MKQLGCWSNNMKTFLMGLLLCFCGSVFAQSEKEQAIAGQSADVATTAIGLALGAAEANPLGVLTLGVKLVAAHQIEQAPVEEQPALWKTYGAFGWGATANNICILLVMASGGVGGIICPFLGLAVGLGVYNE